MTTCSIRFAPVISPAVIRNPGSVRAGRRLYDRGALKEIRAVDVCLNHEGQLGTVSQVFVYDDVEGPWHCAIAQLRDDAPAWIERGTPCSIAFGPVRSIPIGDGERILKAVLAEISILSADRRPAEPGAMVLSVERAKAGRVHHDPPGTMLVRPGIGSILAAR